jgi:two-component system cell cycle sensor histidine kinase/response regulator CckA
MPNTPYPSPLSGVSLPENSEPAYRILVVDDNEAIHDDFRKILNPDAEEEAFDLEEAEVFGRMLEVVESSPKIARRARFHLSFASQGAKALQIVRAARQTEERFSLVFMDVRMPPGWDGLETTLKLWEIDPDLQVVICTAYSDKSWEEMAEKLGNSERVLILKKPFDTIEVLQLAHALTEKWTLLQAARRSHDELERTVSVRTRELVAVNKRLESEIALHKAAVERIREQAMLIEKARDAIVVRDLEDNILFWNHGAERLYGLTAMEAVGRKALDAVYGGVADKNLAAARQVVIEKGSWLGELQQKTKDGQTVIVESRWTLVHDDHGRPKSVLSINTDITEKKQLEAKFLRAQRMESIGTLAGGIAHDLNNILQPISLAMDLFRDELTDPKSRSTLELVAVNAQRATSLVKQVLSFARGVDGERACVRPKSLVSEIGSIIRETFPKSISFCERPAQDVWPVLGDSTQLHQVLLNLCVNSRDAMPKGGILTLTVENADVDERFAAKHADATPGHYVVFTVSDTGSGIPESLREKIFDPFFTTKAQGQGTGLGLATSLSIIRSHGGFITLESEVTRGAAFRIYVPASEAAPVRSLGPVKSLAELRGRGELILAVDDEPVLLNVLCRSLEMNGYRVLPASDGAEGMRAYMENRDEIDLVISDMLMPGMDGPALITALKKLDPDIRIVASTGMTSPESLDTINRAGVTRIVPKPCPARVLLQTVQEVLVSNSANVLTAEPSNTSSSVPKLEAIPNAA